MNFDAAATVPSGIVSVVLAFYNQGNEQESLGLKPFWREGGSTAYAGKPIFILGGATSVGQYGTSLSPHLYLRLRFPYDSTMQPSSSQNCQASARSSPPRPRATPRCSPPSAQHTSSTAHGPQTQSSQTCPRSPAGSQSTSYSTPSRTPARRPSRTGPSRPGARGSCSCFLTRSRRS